MTSASHLPIYNAAFLLAKDMHERVQRFDKGHKYQLGEKILCASVDIIMLITCANKKNNGSARVEELQKLEVKIDEILVYVRIAEELKQFNSAKAYPHLIETVTSISRQCAGWKNSYVK